MDRFAVHDEDFGYEALEPIRPSSTIDRSTNSSLLVAQMMMKRDQALQNAKLNGGPVAWLFTKRIKDIRVYRHFPTHAVKTTDFIPSVELPPPTTRLRRNTTDVYTRTFDPSTTQTLHSSAVDLHSTTTDKTYFLSSLEVKASLDVIMKFLFSMNSETFTESERRLDPHFIDGEIVQQITADSTHSNSHANLETKNSSNVKELRNASNCSPYPQMCTKWSSTKFSSFSPRPLDYCFFEYANIEKTEEGRDYGVAFINSIDSRHMILPSQANKTKYRRVFIDQCSFTVVPTGKSNNTYEITLMYIMDFKKKNFSASFVARYIKFLTKRVVRLQQVLNNTLFQHVEFISKSKWISDRCRNQCVVCTSSFTLLKLRHHCRACGEVVCGQCSKKWSIHNGDLDVVQKRICTVCSLRARSKIMQQVRPTPANSNNLTRPFTTLECVSFSLSFSSFDENSDTTLSNDDALSLEDDDADHFTGDNQLTENENAALLYQIYDSKDVESDILVHAKNIESRNAGSFKVASIVSVEKDTSIAIHHAYLAIVKKLQDCPHFLYVSYSSHHSREVVDNMLKKIAPNVRFIGGSSCDSVFSEEIMFKNQISIGLFGIYDPTGIYIATNCNSIEPLNEGVQSIGAQTLQCLQEAKTSFIKENGHELKPEIIWLSTMLGKEDQVLKKINKVMKTDVFYRSCVVVGTSSSNGPNYFANTDVGNFPSLVSSRGDLNSTGVSIALCRPSVIVCHSLFSGHDITDKNVSITKARGNRIIELDHQPALRVLNQKTEGSLCEMFDFPANKSIRTTCFDYNNRGLCHPLVQVKGYDENCNPCYKGTQPCAFNPDFSIDCFAQVMEGSILSIGHNTRRKLITSVMHRFECSIACCLEDSKLDLKDIAGSFLGVDISYVYPLNDEAESNIMLQRMSNVLGGNPILGNVSPGQQGNLPCNETPIHSNSSISCLIFSNIPKVEK